MPEEPNKENSKPAKKIEDLPKRNGLGPESSPSESEDNLYFFFRPTPYGSRQVVKQAGKLVADWQIQRINAMATSSYWQCAAKVELNFEAGFKAGLESLKPMKIEAKQ